MCNLMVINVFANLLIYNPVKGDFSETNSRLIFWCYCLYFAHLILVKYCWHKSQSPERQHGQKLGVLNYIIFFIS